MGRLEPFGNHTRAELVELITRANAAAKRVTPVIERYSEDPGTAWTNWHESIDLLLTQYEAAS